MDNALFWCGCQQAFKGEPPEKCHLHGDTVKEIVKEPPPKPEPKPKPKPKMKGKTKPSER